MYQKFIQILRDSEMLQSKKFRAFVIGLVIWGLSEAGITNVDPLVIDKLLLFVSGYIGFQAVADFSPRYSKRE